VTERPRVRIHYRRPQDREQIFDQTVVLERDDVIVTLSEAMEFDPPMRIDGEVALETGSSVVWFTFTGTWHDVGSFHLADGTFTGFYGNVLTPPRVDGRVWHTTDLYLDIWVSADGTARLLDEDEFDRAVGRGLVDRDTACRAREEADRLLSQARYGSWPPAVVREWTLERASFRG
jgi:predicted RNA-binding protein associated with RNAse of E/G family